MMTHPVEAVPALTLVRTVDAPRERVFRAWTDPTELARWWWPPRFQTTYEIDLRVGGVYSFRSIPLPDIGVLAVSGTFLEVDPPARLVYTWRWEGTTDPATRVVVEFSDHGAQTEITITHSGFPDEQDRANHAQGWNDCLARLVERAAAGVLTP